MADQKDPQKRDTRRRFEQWARNPACSANTLSAVYGIPMAEVAKREGLKPSMGQSPFAIARGQTFERGLFRDSAADLRKEFEKAGLLPLNATGFADLRLKQNGGPMPDLDTARVATAALLRSIALSEGADKPTIIASATLLIPSGVMLPEALLVVDVIAVQYSPGGAQLVVGEVKTYPDRGGHTDAEELAGARAQAGVYVHALRMVIDELGVSDRLTVANSGFLVLSRPGFNRPSVRAGEDLKFQAWRAKRGFTQLEGAAQALTPLGEKAYGDAGIEAVRKADKVFREICVAFCDLAPACQERALKAGDPAVLGDDVLRLLGDISLDRALALLDGTRPKNDAERELKQRLEGLA